MILTEKPFWVVWAFGSQESVVLTVKLNVPVALGVPVIRPEVPKLSPGGRGPEARENVAGGCPPVVCS